MSPTKLTAKKLREDGVVYDIAEYWQAHAKIRKDLFGFADVVALNGGIVAIQCTTRKNMSMRRNKILASAKAAAWMCSGGQIEIWGWDQPGGKGKRYRLKCETVTARMFRG